MTEVGLGDLHPGGFAHCPMALIAHPEAKLPLDAAVYLAVASLVDFKTWRSHPVLGGRQVRLLERSGIKDPRALRRSLDRLLRLGFIAEARRPGRSSLFELLPTGPEVLDRLQADRNEDLAAAPEPSGGRGGSARPPASTEGTPPASTEGTPPASTEGTFQNPSEPFRDSAGGTPRDPASTEGTLTDGQIANLRRAVGNDLAEDAIAEVRFRQRHPEVAGAVERPAGLARELAECYGGNCRTPRHGNLHGTAARDYHRGRRADYDQKDRADQNRLRTRSTDPDDSLEANRVSQIAALRSEFPQPLKEAAE